MENDRKKRTSSRPPSGAESGNTKKTASRPPRAAMTANGNGSHSSGDVMTEDEQRKIAEAAYYLAERREFSPGYELEDWLTAERQVRGGQQQKQS